jgi:riboflavin kinase/FMN adenylyltransferase
MVYIGPRPTFDNAGRVVEVNILDFSGDLYTLELEIEFVAFTRGDHAFESVAALIEQIGCDEATTRSILRDAPAEPLP